MAVGRSSDETWPEGPDESTSLSSLWSAFGLVTRSGAGEFMLQ